MAKAKNSGGKQPAPAASTYDELARSLKSGRIESLYLLFGEEEFLVEQVLRALKRQILTPGCEDADLYTGDWSSIKPDAGRLHELVATPPFLSSKRVNIIRNSGLFASNAPETPEQTQEFVHIISNLPDFSCLVFVEEKVDKRKKVLYEAVSQNGMAVHFTKRSTEELGRWIAASLKKHDIRITMDAIGSLIDRTDSSMRVLDNEIKKIILSCDGRMSKEVTIQDIETICIPDIRGSVFQMTDAIGARDVGRAIRVLDTLISLKEPIPRVRFMLARHIRQLICAKELGRQDLIISDLKVVPFVARNLLAQSKGFHVEELLSLYDACAISDYSVKTGRIDDRLSMELLLAGAAKKA